MKGCISKEEISLLQMEKYVEERVLPGMGVAGRAFTLQPTDLGNRNKIYFLHIDNFTDTVLKGFPKKERMKNSLVGSQLLERSSIDAPRILFFDTTQQTRKKLGCCFSCEEKIDGKSLGEIDSSIDVIPEVAKFYSNMHNIRSPRWGRLASPRRFGFYRYTADKLAKKFESLTDPYLQLDDSDIKTCIGWFNKKKDSIKTIKQFSLCHGDVNKKNILLSKSSRVYIIDNEAIKYMPPQLEFYRLKLILCGNNSASQELFEKCYFDGCEEKMRVEFEQSGLFYEAFVLLEHVLYFNKKLKQNKGDASLMDYYKSGRKNVMSALGNITRDS